MDTEVIECDLLRSDQFHVLPLTEPHIEITVCVCACVCVCVCVCTCACMRALVCAYRVCTSYMYVVLDDISSSLTFSQILSSILHEASDKDVF